MSHYCLRWRSLINRLIFFYIISGEEDEGAFLFKTLKILLVFLLWEVYLFNNFRQFIYSVPRVLRKLFIEFVYYLWTFICRIRYGYVIILSLFITFLDLILLLLRIFFAWIAFILSWWIFFNDLKLPDLIWRALFLLIIFFLFIFFNRLQSFCSHVILLILFAHKWWLLLWGHDCGGRRLWFICYVGSSWDVIIVNKYQGIIYFKPWSLPFLWDLSHSSRFFLPLFAKIPQNLYFLPQFLDEIKKEYQIVYSNIQQQNSYHYIPDYVSRGAIYNIFVYYKSTHWD